MSRVARFLALAVVLLVGCDDRRIERVEWTVMGTVAALQWKGDCDSAALVADVQDVFSNVETLLNAHDPESELSRLAKLPDSEVLSKCNPLVRPCYAAAFALRDETGRMFNPRWQGFGRMDLGAIAKGFAVDRAAERIAGKCGKAKVLIDLGGNLKSVSGTWTTGITDPHANSQSSQTPQTFELSAGMSCATSGEYFRGSHIKDGRNGSDVARTVASVTVVHAESAMLADGLSTVMFLLGKEKGEEFLRAHHPAAKAVWIK